jgi:hypothetical protein
MKDKNSNACKEENIKCKNRSLSDIERRRKMKKKKIDKNKKVGASPGKLLANFPTTAIAGRVTPDAPALLDAGADLVLLLLNVVAGAAVAAAAAAAAAGRRSCCRFLAVLDHAVAEPAERYHVDPGRVRHGELLLCGLEVLSVLRDGPRFGSVVRGRRGPVAEDFPGLPNVEDLSDLGGRFLRFVVVERHVVVLPR